MNCIGIEDQLRRDGYLLEFSVGSSMQPIIRQRTQQLLIEALKASPKKKDVVLFRRNCGKYVLHRIVGVKQGYYLIRGDNCYENEVVLPKQLVGKLKGYYKGDRFIDCEKNLSYRGYVFFLLLSYPFRLFARKAVKKLHAVYSKIRGRNYAGNKK